jgi:hypothetical protein
VSYLKSKGVDLNVIELAQGNLCTIHHLDRLREAMHVLQEELPASLKQEISEYASKMMNIYDETVRKSPRYRFFQPTMQATTEQFHKFD